MAFDGYKGLWTYVFGPPTLTNPTTQYQLVVNSDGSINAGITGSISGTVTANQGTSPWAVSQKWTAGAGAGLTWTSAFGGEINSLTSGQAVQSSVVVANGTPLDKLMDVSIALNSFTTGAGTLSINLYLYPLNQDGTTFGDGRFASAAAGPPSSQYFVGSIPLVPSVTQAQEGTCWGIAIPPGSFLLVFHNASGATLGNSNTGKYRTYF